MGLRVERGLLFNHNGDGGSRRGSESGSRRTSLGSLRRGVTVGEAGGVGVGRQVSNSKGFL